MPATTLGTDLSLAPAKTTGPQAEAGGNPLQARTLTAGIRVISQLLAAIEASESSDWRILADYKDACRTGFHTEFYFPAQTKTGHRVGTASRNAQGSAP